MHGTDSVLSYGLGSTCHSYPSFEKPVLPKPSQESTAELWGSEARKEKPWIAVGLGLSQSSTEDTPGSVSPKIASSECADSRMAGSLSGRML